MTAALDAAEVLRRRYSALVILIAHEGKDPTKGTKGTSDFEQWADLVLSLEKQGALVKATLRHNRMGPDNFSVFYKIVEYSKDACVRVPVLVPLDGPEPDPVEVDTSKMKPDQIAFRHLVATILREWGAHDYTARITTGMLAADIVRRKAPELFENFDPQKGPSEDDEQRAIRKMIDKLDDFTRKRSRNTPVLHGYSDTELPPGARATARKIRYWFIPRPLHEEDAEED
jgi:hypothetical protein